MRQGKFSELIHNSGPPASSTTEENELEGGGAGGEGEGMKWDQDGEEDGDEEEEEDIGRKKKGKGGKKGGKGGKGKGKKGDEEYSRGGCDFATVEVWFREVIDLVSSPFLSLWIMRKLLIDDFVNGVARRERQFLGCTELSTRRCSYRQKRQFDEVHGEWAERHGGRSKDVVVGERNRFDS